MSAFSASGVIFDEIPDFNARGGDERLSVLAADMGARGGLYPPESSSPSLAMETFWIRFGLQDSTEGRDGGGEFACFFPAHAGGRS